MRLPLAALLLLAASAARAASSPCAELAGVGCWYAPPSAGSSLPLLIYHRGHFADLGGDVPPRRALESSREAFERYGLKKTADEAGMAVLVTYKSRLGVDEDALRRLGGKSRLAFTRRVVAAHSGGYVGLEKTLDAGAAFEELILLDCFYSGSPLLAGKIQARVARGACRGFYTPHSIVYEDGRPTYRNEANFRRNFEPHARNCGIERLRQGRHNSAVNACLGAYLRGEPCPPEPRPRR